MMVSFLLIVQGLITPRELTICGDEVQQRSSPVEEDMIRLMAKFSR